VDPGRRAAGRPTFEATAVGNYRFSLIVRNSRFVASLPAQVLITVVDGANEPPAIRINGSGSASAAIKTSPGVPVTLDASASSGRTGGALSFVWRQSSGPPALLTDPASAKASFTPASSGSYLFTVTVTDQRSNTGQGSVAVFVGTDLTSGGTGAGTVGGLPDTGAIAETASGGGGGGGCQAAPRGTGDPAHALWIVWLLALVAIRRARVGRD
jgi:hypothetical protein